jgi:hypothetical protein
MKHSTKPMRSSSAPRETTAGAVRQLPVDDLAKVQGGTFGGGMSRENFTVN